MPKKSWMIQLEDGTHTVDLNTRWASGKRIIRVDGQIVFESRSALMNTGGDDDFIGINVPFSPTGNGPLVVYKIFSDEHRTIPLIVIAASCDLLFHAKIKTGGEMNFIRKMKMTI